VELDDRATIDAYDIGDLIRKSSPELSGKFKVVIADKIQAVFQVNRYESGGMLGQQILLDFVQDPLGTPFRFFPW
jgi:hypothetical protein